MKHFYADIHCHSTTKPFLTQRGPENDKLQPFAGSPNNIKSRLLNLFRKLIENITEIRLSSQSNFDALFASGHRVVFVSLTPPETGFFVMNQEDVPVLKDLLKAGVAYQRRPYMGTMKPYIVNALTGFSMEDVDFCKKEVNSYYKDQLVAEYNYLKDCDGKQGNGYTLKIVNSYREIEEALANDADTLCIVISIEGAHSFSAAPQYGDLLRSQRDKHSDQDMNMTGLKDFEDNILDLKQWKFPPFFITFYHHQWNGLGGHARSMNRLIGILINQEEGINIGINAKGREVVQYLLSETNGKRILIDVKHMSPRSRRDYYAMLALPEINKGQNIPIICSHCGISTKRKTIEEMIDLADNHDWEELDAPDNYLHECSINLCEEDVTTIFKSKGLIGIQLDEKRIAGKEIIKSIQHKEGVRPEEINRRYASVVVANLLRAVQIIQQKEAWDILCIGSDFDGLINHLDCCPSSLEIPLLESFMLDVLNNGTDIAEPGFNYSISAPEIQQLLFGYTPEEAMEKVFYNNVINFLKANFK